MIFQSTLLKLPNGHTIINQWNVKLKEKSSNVE